LNGITGHDAHTDARADSAQAVTDGGKTCADVPGETYALLCQDD
jgi:hypothetical protein